MNNFKKQQGVGMIEVLITFLLISIGVLGVSTMQRFTLKENMDTAQRSQAVWLFQDITERIRANNSPDAVQQYQSEVKGYIGSCGTAPTACNSVQACNAEDLAKYDAWDLACGSKDVILKDFEITCFNSSNIEDSSCDAVDTLQLSLKWQRLTGKEDKSKAADIQTATFYVVP